MQQKLLFTVLLSFPRRFQKETREEVTYTNPVKIQKGRELSTAETRKVG